MQDIYTSGNGDLRKDKSDSIIQTTGGILHQEDLNFIYSTICEVFNCNKEQITNLRPLQKGLSNSVLTFELNGGKYVFRFPGLGSEVLIANCQGSCQ